MNRILSQRFASALVEAFRLMMEQPDSRGRRQLFDAVNEAFCHVATKVGE